MLLLARTHGKSIRMPKSGNYDRCCNPSDSSDDAIYISEARGVDKSSWKEDVGADTHISLYETMVDEEHSKRGPGKVWELSVGHRNSISTLDI